MTPNTSFDLVNSKLDQILNDLEFVKTRASVYLGRNEALTWLRDDTPVFINTDDFGCPINFLNGGAYEEDYLAVLRSFRVAGTPMLDIGANLGFYSLRMAPYMRGTTIHAFEPVKKVHDLFARSIFLGGHSDRIKLHNFAVSDKRGRSFIAVPDNHVGGSALVDEGHTGDALTEISTVALDEFLPQDFQCNLIKLDVEGHELTALTGLRNILRRSATAVVLFEKLGIQSGIEQGLIEFFGELDMRIYQIKGRSLTLQESNTFGSLSGYFLAARPAMISQTGYERDFFDIFPSDLNAIGASLADGKLCAKPVLTNNEVLFHGPYWHLSKGYYRIQMHGVLDTPLDLTFCENFGSPLAKTILSGDNPAFDFPVSRDAQKFEVVARSCNGTFPSFCVDKITVSRLG